MLGQLHLQTALGGAGSGGKNIQNQGATIQDLDGGLQGIGVKYLFDVTDLGRREFIVEDDQINGMLREVIVDFLKFTAANIRAWIRMRKPLGKMLDNLGASSVGQEVEFSQIFQSHRFRLSRGDDPHQNRQLRSTACSGFGHVGGVDSFDGGWTPRRVAVQSEI